MRPIHINKTVAKTTFQIDNCSNATQAAIEITRVGGNQTIVYPALEITADTVTFMWDDALYNSRSGRYQGIIRIEGCKPFCVPLHLGCKCNMGSSENGYFTSSKPTLSAHKSKSNEPKTAQRQKHSQQARA